MRTIAVNVLSPAVTVNSFGMPPVEYEMTHEFVDKELLAP